MMDNLFVIIKASIVQSWNTTHAGKVAHRHEEPLHVRSNVISICGLQRCSRVEPDIWPTGDQRLEMEIAIEFVQPAIYTTIARPQWIKTIRSQTYVFGKSPVLERIKNDQGFVSAVKKKVWSARFSECQKKRGEGGLRCCETDRCKIACEQNAQLRGRDRFCKPTT